MRALLIPVCVLASACALLPSCGSKHSTTFEEAGAPDASFDLGSLCGHDDCDGDGYSIHDGDCNDNSVQVGPEAYDFTGDGIDNDCNGTVDDPVETCETIPMMAPGSPADF